MTSLVCLAAVIWVVTEKIKVTVKQRTISQISRGWDNILETLIFRLDHGGLCSMPFRRRNNIALTNLRSGVLFFVAASEYREEALTRSFRVE